MDQYGSAVYVLVQLAALGERLGNILLDIVRATKPSRVV